MMNKQHPECQRGAFVSRMCRSLLPALAMLLALPAGAHAQPEYYFDHVHVSVEAGPSPFAAVVYAVRQVDRQAVALETKQYPHVPVYDNRVRVIPAERFVDLVDRLRAADALELGDAAADAPMTLTYRVDVAFDGKANSFAVKGPALLDDPRYAAVVDSVIKLVEEANGPAFYRDLAVPEEDIGVLNLFTFPPAEVELDGVPLGRSTPLYGLEMKPGVHRAVLRGHKLGATRRIKFTIHKGEPTVLNINIKK